MNTTPSILAKSHFSPEIAVKALGEISEGERTTRRTARGGSDERDADRGSNMGEETPDTVMR